MAADARSRLVDGTPYEQHRDYVLTVLRRRCAWLAPDEREAIFHDAYALMLEKQRAGRLDAAAMNTFELRAYLTHTAIHKALDAGKSAERRRTQPIDDAVLLRPATSETPDSAAAAHFDDARLREIVAELPERRKAIVKLRYFFDRSPADIQAVLGITERVYRRELERALRQLSERYELVREGRFCDSRRSLILAFVAGVAGPNRVREARAHLASCPGCLRWANDLRTAADRAAAVAPMPVLVRHPGLHRVVELAHDGRESLMQLAAGIKHQVVALVVRGDPASAGYLTAARPGAVAAAVAGCLAVGSGATYCAVQGLPDPVRGLVTKQGQHDQTDAGRRRAELAPRRSKASSPRRSSSPAAQASAAAPSPTTTRAGTTHPRRRTSSNAAHARRNVVEEEFGLGQGSESGAGTSAIGSTAAASAGAGARGTTAGSPARATGEQRGSAGSASTAASAEFGPEGP